ncbi:hypothetical protein NB705_003523 [Xanthomonas sacchari]|nr:hypothetical protein [Xanthomonas sacchari]
MRQHRRGHVQAQPPGQFQAAQHAQHPQRRPRSQQRPGVALPAQGQQQATRQQQRRTDDQPEIAQHAQHRRVRQQAGHGDAEQEQRAQPQHPVQPRQLPPHLQLPTLEGDDEEAAERGDDAHRRRRGREHAGQARHRARLAAEAKQVQQHAHHVGGEVAVDRLAQTRPQRDRQDRQHRGRAEDEGAPADIVQILALHLRQRRDAYRHRHRCRRMHPQPDRGAGRQPLRQGDHQGPGGVAQVGIGAVDRVPGRPGAPRHPGLDPGQIRRLQHQLRLAVATDRMVGTDPPPGGLLAALVQDRTMAGIGERGIVTPRHHLRCRRVGGQPLQQQFLPQHRPGHAQAQQQAAPTAQALQSTGFQMRSASSVAHVAAALVSKFTTPSRHHSGSAHRAQIHAAVRRPSAAGGSGTPAAVAFRPGNHPPRPCQPARRACGGSAIVMEAT